MHDEAICFVYYKNEVVYVGWGSFKVDCLDRCVQRESIQTVGFRELI